jgi:hypothetical protein
VCISAGARYQKLTVLSVTGKREVNIMAFKTSGEKKAFRAGVSRGYRKGKKAKTSKPGAAGKRKTSAKRKTAKSSSVSSYAPTVLVRHGSDGRVYVKKK